MPEMARFHISHTKLSKKTTPGADNAIEPEVAAAVEDMPTWRGHERKTEIVTRGLLALHGDPPSEEVERLAAELRERLAPSERAPARTVRARLRPWGGRCSRTLRPTEPARPARGVG